MLTLECYQPIFRKKIILMFPACCGLYALWYQLNMVNFFFKVDGWSFIYTLMHVCKLKTDDTVCYVSIAATVFPDLQPSRQNCRRSTCSIKINVKKENPPPKNIQDFTAVTPGPSVIIWKEWVWGYFLKGRRGKHSPLHFLTSLFLPTACI